MDPQLTRSWHARGRSVILKQKICQTGTNIYKIELTMRHPLWSEQLEFLYGIWESFPHCLKSLVSEPCCDAEQPISNCLHITESVWTKVIKYYSIDFAPQNKRKLRTILLPDVSTLPCRNTCNLRKLLAYRSKFWIS